MIKFVKNLFALLFGIKEEVQKTSSYQNIDREREILRAAIKDFNAKKKICLKN